jgi:hypothetical protein
MSSLTIPGSRPTGPPSSLQPWRKSKLVCRLLSGHFLCQITERGLVIALRALQMDHQVLRRHIEMMESTEITPAVQTTIDNPWIWFRDSVHCFLWFLVLVSFKFYNSLLQGHLLLFGPSGQGPNYYNLKMPLCLVPLLLPLLFIILVAGFQENLP